MANIKQQKKRNLTNEKARIRNKSIRSATRTEIRKFREAVESGDKAAAEAQLRVASRKLDKAVTKGVFHRNSAANKKSNMARALNKMGQEEA
ncbi:30S ribosomal protein S20 [Corynebacterium sp. Q4381]|uniref:30S ribosomal protein S20 n=1 Tax=Corynebacterium sp. Marseille-Q4381 TaxID=3121597 RepID=UPI002FE57903